MLKRYMLFFVLSFLVVWAFALVRQRYFAPPATPKPPSKEKEIESETPPESPSDPEKEEQLTAPEKPSEQPEPQPVPPVGIPSVTPEQRQQEQEIWLENDFCRVTFTKYGAAIREISLHTNHTNKEVVIQGDEPVELPGRRLKGRLNPLVITSRGENRSEADKFFDLSDHTFELTEKTDRMLVYELRLEGRFKVTKTFELPVAGYLLTMDVAFENLSEQTLEVPTHQVKVGTLFPAGEKGSYRNIKLLALGEGRVQSFSPKPGKGESRTVPYIRWAAACNEYFALILSPEPEDRKLGHTKVPVDRVIPEVEKASAGLLRPPTADSKKDDEHYFSLGVGVREFDLKVGARIVHRYSFYAGPKEYDRLQRLSREFPDDRQYQKVMSFGGFTFIAVPLLKVLKFSYKIIPNYGLAIIVLTVLIKIILYPLDQKSYRSMKEMQKLQPLIAELRKKYKDDPRQAQVEQMKLFKEHKVNPLGGCLPMLLQMPVLIAMFSMIRTAIELRKAPFVLWIKDLSAPDAVLNWGVHIPILGNTLNILPLLLVATFMLQTKISKAGTSSGQQDPQQKVMGHFMTVFFGIIFYNMPSGLNLYFAVSTVLRAIQQYFVQKKDD